MASKKGSKASKSSEPKAAKVDKSTPEERREIGERLRQEAVANRTPIR